MHRFPQAGAEILLTSGNALPNGRLAAFQLRGKPNTLCVDGVTRAAEEPLALFVSPVPAAALDAKGWDRNPTRLRGEDKINCNRPILSSSFEDVASLNKDVGGVRQIFYFKFSDIARFVDNDLLCLHCLTERNVAVAVELIGAVEEKNREILVCVRPGNIE